MLDDRYTALPPFPASYRSLASVAKHDAEPQLHLASGVNTARVIASMKANKILYTSDWYRYHEITMERRTEKPCSSLS